MRVNIIPVNEEAGEFRIANGTWSAMANGPLKGILGRQTSNDPIRKDASQARACAKALRGWEPPDGRFVPNGRAMFIEFFNECGGFSTS